MDPIFDDEDEPVDVENIKKMMQDALSSAVDLDLSADEEEKLSWKSLKKLPNIENFNQKLEEEQDDLPVSPISTSRKPPFQITSMHTNASSMDIAVMFHQLKLKRIAFQAWRKYQQRQIEKELHWQQSRRYHYVHTLTKCLSKWRTRLKAKQKLLLRIVMHAWKVHTEQRRFKRIQSGHSMDHYNRHICTTLFKCWRDFYIQQKTKKAKMSLSEQHSDMVEIRKTFGAWKMYHTLQKEKKALELKAKKYYQSSLQKKGITHWLKVGTAIHQAQFELCLQREINRTTRLFHVVARCAKKWREKTIQSRLLKNKDTLLMPVLNGGSMGPYWRSSTTKPSFAVPSFSSVFRPSKAESSSLPPKPSTTINITNDSNIAAPASLTRRQPRRPSYLQSNYSFDLPKFNNSFAENDNNALEIDRHNTSIPVQNQNTSNYSHNTSASSTKINMDTFRADALMEVLMIEKKLKLFEQQRTQMSQHKIEFQQLNEKLKQMQLSDSHQEEAANIKTRMNYLQQKAKEYVNNREQQANEVRQLQQRLEQLKGIT